MLVTTTLSAAVQGGQSSSAVVTGQFGIITVASATGISAPTPNTGLTQGFASSGAQDLLFVDRELMEVRAISGTTVTVVRGVGSTAATSHLSGALIFVIPTANNPWLNAQLGGQPQSLPAGSCTRSNEIFLPRINFSGGVISDCNGGQWVNGDAAQTTRSLVTGSTTGANGFRYPDPGGVATTALQTSGTAPAANTQIECTEFDAPFSMLLSGIAPLNGTTVGTDKHWVILYDSGGAVLATSAVAGATTSGASTYQKYNFLTPYYTVGPGRYFACYGSNGTTDTVRHSITGTNDNILGGAITGQTFGTAIAIAAPTTYTTAKAPYFMVY
jgi:hypothetical protein